MASENEQQLKFLEKSFSIVVFRKVFSTNVENLWPNDIICNILPAVACQFGFQWFPGVVLIQVIDLKPILCVTHGTNMVHFNSGLIAQHQNLGVLLFFCSALESVKFGVQGELENREYPLKIEYNTLF